MDTLFLKSNETVKNPSIFVSNLTFNIVDLLIKQLIKCKNLQNIESCN